ncbi:MAG: phosphoribosyltransferase family protein, partial [Rikenellaceae bacterium]
VLSGAYMFTVDVLKKITFDSDLAFIKISSYDGIKQSGNIKVLLGINQSIVGRDVIILDEIVDSGNTIEFLKNEYKKMGAASVAVATLIYKPHSLKEGVTVDFWGIEMTDDAFLVGYGLDYNEKGRTMKEIYILDKQ